MYQRYCELRDAKNYKDSDVAKALDITPSTFSDWKKGKSVPNANKLLRIARYLNTTVEYLLTGFDPTPAAQPITPLPGTEMSLAPDEQELVEKYRAIDDRGRENVWNTLEAEYRRRADADAGEGAGVA